MARFVTANDKTLWAAIDPDSHHLNGRVCERKFAAYLAPFRTEDEAIAALLAADGILDAVGPTAVLREPVPLPRPERSAT
jgi:hypothetical protein